MQGIQRYILTVLRLIPTNHSLSDSLLVQFFLTLL